MPNGHDVHGTLISDGAHGKSNGFIDQCPGVDHVLSLFVRRSRGQHVALLFLPEAQLSRPASR
jgi:hypothetical protein